MSKGRPGPVPLSKQSNEPATTFKFNLTQSQRDFVFRRAYKHKISASEYMRRTINVMMFFAGEKRTEKIEKRDTNAEVMDGLSIIVQALWVELGEDK